MPKDSSHDYIDKVNIDFDIHCLKTFEHGVSGAKLYLAEPFSDIKDNKGKIRKNSYVVLWAAPWQKNVRDYEVYSSKEKAQDAFNKHKKKGPPLTSALQRDFQVSKVYGWEAETLHKRSPKLTPEQMHQVVKKISNDFNIVAPKVRYKKPNPNHEYPASYYHLNQILMQHKELSFVIHEVAHAIDHKLNKNEWSDHGPSFVRTLIRLAERYQYWHNPKELEESATRAGIKIAPDKSLPKLPKPK
jgi:hypothetical protein